MNSQWENANRKVCRCGQSFVWGKVSGEAGAVVPLDPRAPVYSITGLSEDGRLIIERTGDAAVSHFATCKFASAFSGKNRKP